MNLSSNYEHHVQTMKQLNMSESFHKAREPYKEDFEKIYNEAKEQNINMTNAKDFLKSLSSEELSTLQNFTLLADEINIDKLDDEGSYNLLLHHYEKFDFNSDGVISNGIGKSLSLIPVNMPKAEKEVLVASLNDMEEDDRFKAVLMLNPPRFNLNDDGTIGVVENSELFDYERIKETLHRIFNPLPGETRSEEILNIFKEFENIFDNKYKEYVSQENYKEVQQMNSTNIMKAKLSSQ